MNNNILCIGKDCTGCGTCAHSCRRGCISMVANAEGFLYPSVSENCNGCGLCLKKCPQKEVRQESANKQDAYIGLTKSKKIYKKAASGGIFGTLAKAFLEKENTYVCGAAYYEGEVQHVIISKIEEVSLLQNSKYVQSNLNDVFPRIKTLIKQGAHVLFCGTPCQVSGLYSYLSNRPENLFTLDLICHGVPSPLFLKKDIAKYAANDDVKSVVFRWKQPHLAKTKGIFFFYLTTKQGRRKLVSSSFDPYFACFMRNESFRESCYSCHYANLNRCGDITIGDCDSASFYPSFHPDLSRSTIIVNTAQGRNLWERHSELFEYLPLDLIREASRNHQLHHPSQRPPRRDFIYKDVVALTAEQMQQKYCKRQTLLHKCLFIMQQYLPNKITNNMLKFVRG